MTPVANRPHGGRMTGLERCGAAAAAALRPLSESVATRSAGDRAGATQRLSPRLLTSVAIVLLLAALPLFGDTSTTAPKLPGKVSIAQKLDTKIPLNLMFRTDSGGVVRLKDLFSNGKPKLLNFVYYNCPMLCPMVLEGTTSTLTQLKFDIGKEYDVITVSIDPRDTVTDAAEIKDKYIRRYGRLDSASGWHFLTGNETTIKQLTDAVGFQFAYDAKMNQFAHGAALLVLTPDGRTSRYFYGFEYKPRDVRLAIVEASSGKVGTAVDQLLLLCYHYDPAVGKYSRTAMTFVRAGGVTTLAALAGFIFVLFRRERDHSETENR